MALRFALVSETRECIVQTNTSRDRTIGSPYLISREIQNIS